MKDVVFSPYQKFVIAVLAFLQFTLVLDFMIMSPLGALMMPELDISTRQFGVAISVFAFSAGAAGILSAGFADRFDRKRLLLFFYSGFVIGTFLCGIANNYHYLLMARIITGLFGGVIGSISMAIVADLFAMEVRGRVMGSVQTAFAASQIMGLPLGLFLSNHWGWHAPFLMIAGVSAAVGILIAAKLRPINAHLHADTPHNAFSHLVTTVTRGRYLRAFAATTLLSTGGFMLMPFASAFSVNNLKISLHDLPWIYLATGIASFFVGPLMGQLSDRIGKYKVFCLGSCIGIAVVLIYCNLGVTPLAGVVLINVVLFATVTTRIVSSQALISGVPEMRDRGAFMAVNSSVAQIAGGIAASLAGLIVFQVPGGKLEHYEVLGGVVAGAMLVTMVLMYQVHKLVTERQAVAIAPTGEVGGAGVPPV